MRRLIASLSVIFGFLAVTSVAAAEDQQCVVGATRFDGCTCVARMLCPSTPLATLHRSAPKPTSVRRRVAAPLPPSSVTERSQVEEVTSPLDNNGERAATESPPSVALVAGELKPLPPTPSANVPPAAAPAPVAHDQVKPSEPRRSNSPTTSFVLGVGTTYLQGSSLTGFTAGPKLRVEVQGTASKFFAYYGGELIVAPTMWGFAGEIGAGRGLSRQVQLTIGAKVSALDIERHGAPRQGGFQAAFGLGRSFGRLRLAAEFAAGVKVDPRQNRTSVRWIDPLVSGSIFGGIVF